MNDKSSVGRLGIVMDPIADIHYHKDTSLALLWAARDCGFELYYLLPECLFLANGVAQGCVTTLQVFNDPNDWFSLGETKVMNLGELDVILMRQDPPVDQGFIHTTYILEMAQQQGCLVVNDPRSLRDCNEKIFASQFPQCCPPHLVSCDQELLRDFHVQQGDVIYKPLDGMGGRKVFRVDQTASNIKAIIEVLTDNGRCQIMAQRYITAISEGDKRIIMIDGEPVDYCLARIPAKDDIRGNLAANADGRVQKLSERDQWIAQQVGATLKERNLLWVGLDVIGDYLTEINVTSPTCVQEIEHGQPSLNICMRFMEIIKSKLEDK